jgi:hypothetical protein
MAPFVILDKKKKRRLGKNEAGMSPARPLLPFIKDIPQGYSAEANTRALERFFLPHDHNGNDGNRQHGGGCPQFPR